MITTIACGAVYGVDAFRVNLEVDYARAGLPAFTMVGLAEGAVRESRDRVFAALRNGNFRLPPARITVNLAPADRKKAAVTYDLPLAIGLQAASGALPERAGEGCFFTGELSLTGELTAGKCRVPVNFPWPTGVLFLDELLEFRKQTLEVLRQPLENGAVTIARAAHTLTYPARVMLIAAMNPCPCGYLTDTRKSCTCSRAEIQRYRSRLSGPLLDRIDLHVEVPAVAYKDLRGDCEKGAPGKSSADMRASVEAARERQRVTLCPDLRKPRAL